MSKNKVRLFICGDFCSTPSSPFMSIASDLRSLIDSCNLKICNFEGPVKSDGRKLNKIPPNIQQHPDVPDFIENMGFNVISLANNHAFDYGDDGFLATQRAFRKAKVIGAGTFDEAYKVEITEVNGISIGILALTYASFGAWDLSTGKFGCAEMDHLRVNHLILETKSKVDYLFIYLHDGIEYIDIPLPEQRERYRDFVDYGADGVFVHHSHVPQGWEVYKGRPIFYSLGNFFFNSKNTPDYKASKRYWYNGLAVVLEIREKNNSLKFEVYNILNDRNRKISIDTSEKMLIHTTEICDLLKESKLYESKVRQETDNLWKAKYMGGMVSSLVAVGLRTNFLGCLKSVVKALLSNNSKLVYSYIRNKNHRSNVIRLLREIQKYR